MLAMHSIGLTILVHKNRIIIITQILTLIVHQFERLNIRFIASEDRLESI